MSTNTVEKIVHKIEGETVSVEKKRQSEAAALSGELQSARAALTTAEGVPDALLNAARVGEDVAPSTLTEARTAVEIAAAKVEGMTARLARLNRTSAAQEATVADLLVPLFQRSLMGVPVIATVAPVGQVLAAVNGAEGPALILCQHGNTQRHTSQGFVAADRIDVLFVRPSWGADIRVRDLEEEAQGMGINLKVSANGRAGDYQTFTLKVASALEEIPLLDKIDDDAVNGVVQGFGSALLRVLHLNPRLPVITRGVYKYTTGECRIDLVNASMSEDIDADGTRTVKVSFGCHIRTDNLSREAGITGPRLVPATGFQSGVGVLKAVDVSPMAENDPRARTVSQTVAMTYVSRVK